MRYLLAPLLLLGPTLEARDKPQGVSAQERRRTSAIHEGIAYLKQIQNVDGSWGRTEVGVVGITSLSVLAFMAAGHQPNRGPHGPLVRKGVGFLLKHSLPKGSVGKPAGYIHVAGDRNSRMHGHGYALQVLVLAYGTEPKGDLHRELESKIKSAVRVIESAQTLTGGWGYEPYNSTFHEGSVTVTVVQALRLARDAGFLVDKQVQTSGLKYLRDSQKKRDGSFKFTLSEDRSSAALTAAALTALHGFGEYYGKSIRKGLEYLRNRYRHPRTIQWPHYAHYYAAQAFYRAGGADWRRWRNETVPWILSQRRRLRTGVAFWDDVMTQTPAKHGRAFATALSCLALSVPDGYLPLFQK